MIDRIRLLFPSNFPTDFHSAAWARLRDPEFATLKSQRPVAWLDGATTYKYQLHRPLSIDATIQEPFTVEIAGAASRHSGFDSPVRESRFRYTNQQDAAQASLLLDNASARNAIESLVREVVPDADDDTIGNAIVAGIDIPINLACPQEPLEAILSAAASSRPGCLLQPYAHGEVRNLSIKGFKRELVLYDKALQMLLRDFSLARLELRIKGSHTVWEVLTGGRALWGTRFIRVRDLDVLTLYRALAQFVHELVGDRREVIDVSGGDLDVRLVLELIAAESARQGLLIDGMTVPVFLAHATTPRRARAVTSRLASLQTTSLDIDDILPRDHWNPRYIVPDVLAHLAANTPDDRTGPQRSEGREVGVEGPRVAPAADEQGPR